MSTIKNDIKCKIQVSNARCFLVDVLEVLILVIQSFLWKLYGNFGLSRQPNESIFATKTKKVYFHLLNKNLIHFVDKNNA